MYGFLTEMVSKSGEMHAIFNNKLLLRLCVVSHLTVVEEPTES